MTTWHPISTAPSDQEIRLHWPHGQVVRGIKLGLLPGRWLIRNRDEHGGTLDRRCEEGEPAEWAPTNVKSRTTAAEG